MQPPKPPEPEKKLAVKPPPGSVAGNVKWGGVTHEGWLLPPGHGGEPTMPGRARFLTDEGEVLEVPKGQVVRYPRRAP